MNSAQRVSAVGRRFALELDEPVEDRAVLLLDDLVVTGWTLTRAAVALRARGADRGAAARAGRRALTAGGS